MKTVITCSLLSLMLTSLSANCQGVRLWTEKDRAYLIENLERTRREIIEQTKDLGELQWSYREDSTKWSIAQVVEHLGLYERIFAQEADIMLSMPADPLLDSLSRPDSTYLTWMSDPGRHKAEWNAEPLGLMKGADNLKFFLFGRDHIIDFIRNTTYDLKSHFTFRWGQERRRSIHSLMVVHFGHTSRHLSQILRIKGMKNYPKR